MVSATLVTSSDLGKAVSGSASMTIGSCFGGVSDFAVVVAEKEDEEEMDW